MHQLTVRVHTQPTVKHHCRKIIYLSKYIFLLCDSQHPYFIPLPSLSFQILSFTCFEDQVSIYWTFFQIQYTLFWDTISIWDSNYKPAWLLLLPRSIAQHSYLWTLSWLMSDSTLSFNQELWVDIFMLLLVLHPSAKHLIPPFGTRQNVRRRRSRRTSLTIGCHRWWRGMTMAPSLLFRSARHGFTICLTYVHLFANVTFTNVWVLFSIQMALSWLPFLKGFVYWLEIPRQHLPLRTTRGTLGTGARMAAVLRDMKTTSKISQTSPAKTSCGQSYSFRIVGMAKILIRQITRVIWRIDRVANALPRTQCQ